MIDPIGFERFVVDTAAGLELDVMLEAKAKDLALLRLREQLAARGVEVGYGSRRRPPDGDGGTMTYTQAWPPLTMCETRSTVAPGRTSRRKLSSVVQACPWRRATARIAQLCSVMRKVPSSRRSKSAR